NLAPIEMPFGGVKQSGIGRENSLAAIEHYTQRKTIYVELGDVDSPYWIIYLGTKLLDSEMNYSYDEVIVPR
ncbi:MAG: aldehyde dehydrogenase family protein, partial [Acidimicrobiia bacterium]|nr:aldehyde dehydrogenase family protein [Acidimicrobiia bacterium]